jgi:hypothetical protein
MLRAKRLTPRLHPAISESALADIGRRKVPRDASAYPDAIKPEALRRLSGERSTCLVSTKGRRKCDGLHYDGSNS